METQTETVHPEQEAELCNLFHSFYGTCIRSHGHPGNHVYERSGHVTETPDTEHLALLAASREPGTFVETRGANGISALSFTPRRTRTSTEPKKTARSKP